MTGLFGVFYEALIVMTAVRLVGAAGFLASHVLLSLRRSRQTVAPANERDVL